MMEKELVCKCGSDKFHVSFDGKYAACPNCKTWYDKSGIIVTPPDPFLGSTKHYIKKITINGEEQK